MEEKIGLILGVVLRFVDKLPVGIDVVSRRNQIAPQFISDLHELAEFDKLVAPAAGVGCHAVDIGVDKRIVHLLLECFGNIIDVILDPEVFGDHLHFPDIFLMEFIVIKHLQIDTDNFISVFFELIRRKGRINSARES